MAQTAKNPPAVGETWVRSLGWEDPLEKGMAAHCSVLSWRAPMATGRGVAESDMTSTKHSSGVLHECLFLLQDPVQDTALHSVAPLPQSPPVYGHILVFLYSVTLTLF